MRFTRIPRGLVVDSDPRSAGRVIEVLRRLRTDLVDVELRTSYAAGDDWGAFDIAFWGENCMDYAVLKKYPPVAMPPELYVYGNTVSGVPGAVARLLQGLFPDTIIQSTTYGTVNKLLQH